MTNVNKPKAPEHYAQRARLAESVANFVDAADLYASAAADLYASAAAASLGAKRADSYTEAEFRCRALAQKQFQERAATLFNSYLDARRHYCALKAARDQTGLSTAGLVAKTRFDVLCGFCDAARFHPNKDLRNRIRDAYIGVRGL